LLCIPDVITAVHPSAIPEQFAGLWPVGGYPSQVHNYLRWKPLPAVSTPSSWLSDPAVHRPSQASAFHILGAGIILCNTINHGQLCIFLQVSRCLFCCSCAAARLPRLCRANGQLFLQVDPEGGDDSPPIKLATNATVVASSGSGSGELLLQVHNDPRSGHAVLLFLKSSLTLTATAAGVDAERAAGAPLHHRRRTSRPLQVHTNPWTPLL